MEELIKAAEALITYIEEEDVYDQSDDDGDGYVDHSQSHELKTLTNNLQHAIEEAEPVTNAIKSVKEGLIAVVQTAIARQTKRP